MPELTLLAHRKNVHSQRGEDGIIEAILSRFPELNYWCVEFGAWDGIYLSNTRNLIESKGYQGVLIEPDCRSFQKLQENIQAFPRVKAMKAFVGFSADDGLDPLLSPTGCPRDLDFMSIDVDGNDIHVWRAIDKYRPKLICIEYNPTIPTGICFEQPAHREINWGCSLSALVRLGKEKRYELVCANEINAFFVTAELFSLFDIQDNVPEILRPGDAPRNFVFAGFDGTLLVSGEIQMPWHGITASGEDIQILPAFLRKNPMNYNLVERYSLRAFRRFHRARARWRGLRQRNGRWSFLSAFGRS